MTASRLPEGRYRRRVSAGRRRWAGLAGLLLAGLAGLMIAVLGYHNLGPAPVHGETLSFGLLDDNTGMPGVHLRLSVVREDPSRPAVCIVRARSRDGVETGRKEVYVPPAAGPMVLTTVVHTSRPPVVADVYGCSLQVPAYLVPASRY